MVVIMLSNLETSIIPQCFTLNTVENSLKALKSYEARTPKSWLQHDLEGDDKYLLRLSELRTLFVYVIRASVSHQSFGECFNFSYYFFDVVDRKNMISSLYHVKPRIRDRRHKFLDVAKRHIGII